MTRDVVRRTTTCAVGSVGSYDVPYDGRATEDYSGTVTVDLRSHVQTAHAECRFELVWPGTGTVLVRSTMDAVVDVRGTQVRIDLEAHEGAQRVARRQWTESFPSQIAHSLGLSGA